MECLNQQAILAAQLGEQHNMNKNWLARIIVALGKRCHFSLLGRPDRDECFTT
jgi:hypothetical protein